MDFDELIGSSEPVQPLRGTSSTEWVSDVHNFRDGYQGVQDETASKASAGCSTAGETEWSWADVDDLPAAPPMDWVPEGPRDEWAERLFQMLPMPLRQWINGFEPNMRGWRQAHVWTHV